MPLLLLVLLVALRAGVVRCRVHAELLLGGSAAAAVGLLLFLFLPLLLLPLLLQPRLAQLVAAVLRHDRLVVL